MSIENALCEYLATDAAALPSSVRLRLFEDELPENAELPAIVVSADTNDNGTLDGGHEMGVSRVTVDCLALDAARARRLRKAVRQATHRKFNVVWGRTRVESSVSLNRTNAAPPEALAGQAFNKRLTLEVMHAGD